MFENILHQERVCQSLMADIEAGCLPQALLFEGPDYAGKLSAALELVRVLSCHTAGAPWSCTCNSCIQQKHLLSPYLMLLGKRYFSREIRGAGLALQAEDREGSRFLFLRSVRKLIRRFDPILWEGDAKLSSAAKHIEKLEELLGQVAPGKPALSPAELEPVLTAVYGLADNLVALLPQEGINIAMVRRVVYWAHTADARQRKFIIIENAEAMNESTRNSLLKVLEEPPPEVYFILMSSRKSAIMQTLLSRVRPYAFAARGAGEQSVLQRIFKQQPQAWPSLQQFFVGLHGVNELDIRQRAHQFADALLRQAGLACLLPPGPIPTVEAVTEGVTKDRDSLEDLVRLSLRRLCDQLVKIDEPTMEGKLAQHGLRPIQACDRLQALVRRLQSLLHHTQTYNLAAASLLERVYFEAAQLSGA